jgi:hypothetical protein
MAKKGDILCRQKVPVCNIQSYETIIFITLATDFLLRPENSAGSSTDVYSIRIPIG